jgi:Large ribosomal RNA subunit accumulation protein YceD
MASERPWSVLVRVEDVPEAGKHVRLEANEAARAALAEPAGVDAVERLVGSFDLARRGRHGLHVSGRVNATVRQTCVVSLEPMVNEVDEAVDVDFVPAHKGAAADSPDEEAYLARAADEPEPLVGGGVDLGLLATELLILGVDPYPRKADATLRVPPTPDPTGHSFAGLAALKKKGTVKD